MLLYNTSSSRSAINKYEGHSRSNAYFLKIEKQCQKIAKKFYKVA